ncbi:MAG: hypothetical protein A3E85_01165 [Gammaproteobacteria bacterium RIFCSPHIGHO2_12_FULL_45_12]|nr:MAG: hypothetical protein A3E85_01165 [Gammaproteobacteria bacterium RIFCSPHIGHO2_12_FULL_45_12]
MQAPVVITPIPAQRINVQAVLGPLNLNEFIKLSQPDGMPVFSAQLKDGAGLPQGLICTPDGLLTGIPAFNTQGQYEVVVTAANEAGSVQATFALIIEPVLAADDRTQLEALKAQVSRAVSQNQPVPELSDFLNRPISVLDVYYLLERWAVLKIWNAFNLDAPGEKVRLTLEGASEHYAVYDRGSCLVTSPVDLFSEERTLEDGLRTARAMAREVHRRGWAVELVGFEKLTRAAWVEMQRVGAELGKPLNILNYEPSVGDKNLYTAVTASEALRGGMDQ